MLPQTKAVSAFMISPSTPWPSLMGKLLQHARVQLVERKSRWEDVGWWSMWRLGDKPAHTEWPQEEAGAWMWSWLPAARMRHRSRGHFQRDLCLPPVNAGSASTEKELLDGLGVTQGLGCWHEMAPRPQGAAVSCVVWAGARPGRPSRPLR